eukprot:2209738-Amphidinium_carterae.1
MSTRYFEFQLSVVDKQLLEKLEGIEEQQRATATFWRTKSSRLCSRLDAVEIGIESFERELAGLHLAGLLSETSVNEQNREVTRSIRASIVSTPAVHEWRQQVVLQMSRLQQVMKERLTRTDEVELKLKLKPTAEDIKRYAGRSKVGHRRGHHSGHHHHHHHHHDHHQEQSGLASGQSLILASLGRHEEEAPQLDETYGGVSPDISPRDQARASYPRRLGAVEVISGIRATQHETGGVTAEAFLADCL